MDNSNKRYGQNLEDRQKTEFWDFQNICDFISNADLMKWELSKIIIKSDIDDKSNRIILNTLFCYTTTNIFIAYILVKAYGLGSKYNLKGQYVTQWLSENINIKLSSTFLSLNLKYIILYRVRE